MLESQLSLHKNPQVLVNRHIASVKYMPRNTRGALNYPSTPPLTGSVGLSNSQRAKLDSKLVIVRKTSVDLPVGFCINLCVL